MLRTGRARIEPGLIKSFGSSFELITNLICGRSRFGLVTSAATIIRVIGTNEALAAVCLLR